MDRDHRRLFVAGREPAMLVMNANDGKVIQSFPSAAVPMLRCSTRKRG
jgi:hypothetical protein